VTVFETLRKMLAQDGANATAAGAVADGDHRRRLATAALLLEVAWADDTAAGTEKATIAGILADKFGLDAQESAQLMAAAEAHRHDATDLYNTTSLLRTALARQELRDVLEALWRVVYADGALDAHEDALLHRIARMLGLDHAELIALKLKVRDGAGE
jgi:uncharacterized tellurite resistance protein B-like protein